MRSPFRTILPVCVCLGAGFFNQANASIVNNINGMNYEWLEFSNTLNLSRASVESMLIDSNNSLYGYRYATRTETQALLESYMPYVPAELNHWETYLAPSAQAFFNDFGITLVENFGTTYQIASSDGSPVSYNMYLTSYFNYGAAGECGIDYSCKGNMLAAALDWNIQAQFMPAHRGFDATWATPDLYPVYVSDTAQASLLVRDVFLVPLPAASWLFVNGFMLLAGLARYRKK